MVGEPIAAEDVLADDHQESYKYGVGGAQFVVTGKAVAAENETAYDGLQQVVGEAHASEDAQVTEHLTDTLKGIPGRDDSRDDHQQDEEIVDGRDPQGQTAEINNAQDDDQQGRDAEDKMPYLQIPSLIVELPLPS